MGGPRKSSFNSSNTPQRQQSSGTAQMTFDAPVKNGRITYSVEVISQKQKFEETLIVRKVRVTRKVYRKGLQVFFNKS